MNAPAIPKTLPSEEDIALARESGRALSTVLQTRAETHQIDFHDEQGTVRTVSIPTSALRLLLDVLTELLVERRPLPRSGRAAAGLSLVDRQPR